jgi:hypothetical protein
VHNRVQMKRTLSSGVPPLLPIQVMVSSLQPPSAVALVSADGLEPFKTDRLANIRKLGVVTRYGSPWWLIRLYMAIQAKVLRPRDPQFMQQRLYPELACPLQYGQVAAGAPGTHPKENGECFRQMVKGSSAAFANAAAPPKGSFGILGFRRRNHPLSW